MTDTQPDDSNAKTVKRRVLSRFAFTLAEVLITLGVVGIAAEITIPTLVNNINEQTYKTAYKKAYASISQALLIAKSNSELLPLPATTTTQRNLNFYSIMSHFQIARQCGSYNSSGTATFANITSCWATKEYAFTSYPIPAGDVVYVDNSGMAWALVAPRADASSTGWGFQIFVDTNGLKSPNKYGQDRFQFSQYTNANMELIGLGVLPDSPGAAAFGWNETDICPSYASSPCYYKSWITGDK